MEAKNTPPTPVARTPRPKKANGEGTLVQVTRANGRTSWRAGETVSLWPGGKPVRVFGEGQTRQAAREALRKNIIKRQVALGELPPSALQSYSASPTVLTTAQWCEVWMASKTELAEGTLNQYRTQLRLYFLPYFGTLPLASLSRQAMEDHFRITLPELTKPDGTPRIGPATMKALVKLWRSVLEAAVRQGKLERHPMATVQTPKGKPTDHAHQEAMHAMTQWVPQQLVDGLQGHPDEARWLLALFSLRQSEALGLTDDCLSGMNEGPKRAKLRVRQQLKQHHAQHGCGTTAMGKWRCGRQADYCPQKFGSSDYYLSDRLKTEASYRTIPLVEPLYSALREHLKKQEALRQSPTYKPQPGLEHLLFTDREGKPRRPQDDRRAWKKLLDQHGVPQELRVHDARHLAASVMLSMTEVFTTEQVMKAGGWGSPKILMETYAHLGASYTRPALEAYGEHLTERRKPKNS